MNGLGASTLSVGMPLAHRPKPRRSLRDGVEASRGSSKSRVEQVEDTHRSAPNFRMTSRGKPLRWRPWYQGASEQKAAKHGDTTRGRKIGGRKIGDTHRSAPHMESVLEDFGMSRKIGDTHRSAPHMDSVLEDFGMRFTSGRQLEAPDEGLTPREGTVGTHRLRSRSRLVGVHNFRIPRLPD